jgi:hypothetical protein
MTALIHCMVMYRKPDTLSTVSFPAPSVGQRTYDGQ